MKTNIQYLENLSLKINVKGRISFVNLATKTNGSHLSSKFSDKNQVFLSKPSHYKFITLQINKLPRSSSQSQGEVATINLPEPSSFFNNHPIITLLFSLSVTIFLARKWFFPKQNNKRLPPSPPKFPILGHLHKLGLHPHRSLHSLSTRYGPLMLLHLGSSPTLIVSSADAAREIMKTHDLHFSNRPKSSIVRRLLYDSKDLAFSNYGEYWRQMRSITVLQLLSPQRVRSFRPIREEETSLMISKIIKQSQEDSGSCGVNLSDMFMVLTNDIICRVAFGRKYSEGEEGRKFKELLEGFSQGLGLFDVGHFIPWLSWLKYVTGLHQKVERVYQEFDRFLERVIDDHVTRRRSEVVRENEMDFADVLLKIQEDVSGGVSLARDNIKAILLDAFAAGTDTIYTALEWAMTEILRHPHVLEKAQKEIRDIVGPKQSVIEGDIGKMHYFKAVIKETLRMHPPVPLLVPRESSKDVNIQGFDIAAGTTVFINAWAIGRDSKTWEEPERFKPERFMGSQIEFKGQDFELIPFGAGRRGCPGITFAATTMEFALASLLYKLDWALPGGVRGEDLDISESAGMSVQKHIPLLVVPIPPSF